MSSARDGSPFTSASESCSTAIMPRPSRSTFTIPMSAQSSLSHWTTTRPGILAFSSGTTASSWPRQMTMPPECCPRWRGRSWICPQSDAKSRTRGEVKSRPTDARWRGSVSAGSANSKLFITFASRSTCAGSKPSAFPTSRAALRPRYVITLAVIAAPSRPYFSYTCWITRSRRSPLGRSRSMSGHSPRSSDRKRSKSRSMPTGSTAVMPRL